jgi:hypothetical protein
MEKLLEVVLSMQSMPRPRKESICHCELVWQLEASQFGFEASRIDS